MSCPDIAISGVDQLLYTRLLQLAVRAGASQIGDTWHFRDLEFSLKVDVPSSTLHVDCTKKPFYVSCGEVESKLRELIAQAREDIG